MNILVDHFKTIVYLYKNNNIMGKNVVRLTESDLVRIVKRVLDEQSTGDVESLNDCISKKQIRDHVDVNFSTSCKAAFQKLDNGKIDKKALYDCAADMKFAKMKSDGTSNYRYFGGELDKCLKVINEQSQPKRKVYNYEIDTCIEEYEIKPPQSCLAVIEKITSGGIPDMKSVDRCTVDLEDTYGFKGLEFIGCITRSLEGRNPFVKY